MEGKERADPDQFSWGLAAGEVESVNHGYFFGTDYDESSMFGWSVQVESTDLRCYDGGFFDFDRIESDLTGSGGADGCAAEEKSAPNLEDDSSRSIHEPMEENAYMASDLSQSSSDDPTDKWAASGGSSKAAAGKPPLDTERKNGKKRIRQPRFAFVTKSEIDHLEDGYRWRKYGQKAVKNSPFPRSYYRCTNSKCMVKKRVERSREDPSSVITTYEGQHCHYSVGFPRGGFDTLARRIAPAAAASNPHDPYFRSPTRFQHTPQQINSISTAHESSPPNDKGKARADQPQS